MAAFTAFPNNADAEKGFKTLGENINGSGISPNGQYFVGTSVAGEHSINGMKMESFIYNTKNGTLTWITEADKSDYTKCGRFNAVSDNGIICGDAINTDIKLASENNPISAAIWENGKCTLLEYGDFDISTMTGYTDGSFSQDISEDGSVVVGNFSTSNGAYYTPCKWVKNSEGKYVIEFLTVPENMKNGYAKKVSSDGRVFGMITSNEDDDKGTYLCIWDDDKITILTHEDLGIELRYLCVINIIDVSPNGRFVIFNERNTSKNYIYDTETKECRRFSPFDESYELEWNALSYASIDNNGNVAGAYDCGNVVLGPTPYTHSFWYSYERNTIYDFSYYMTIAAEGVNPDIDFTFDEVTLTMPNFISGDGLTIAGNAGINSQFIQSTPKTWILNVDDISNTEIPLTPTGLKAKSDALKEVKLTWTKDETEYKTLTLKSYNIYRDGELVGTTEATEQEMSFRDKDIYGHPEYTVEAVLAKADGGTMLSQRSTSLKASIPDTYALPFFDDFDSGSLDTNYWATEADYGDIRDTQWGIDGYGLLQTTCAAIYVSNLKPHSSSLVSRPMDATNEESVNVSFANIYGFILAGSDADQSLSNDSISLEVSTDMGNSWNTVKDWSIAELNPQHKWNMINVDISKEVAGKIFSIRFRSHGQGKSLYYVDIENVKITTGNEVKKDAPEGLTGCKNSSDTPLSLIWKNNFGAYQLNHINSVIEGMFTLGNEGKDLIGANAFDKDDLAPYKGKYLTGVTTTINFYDWYEVDKGIHAAIVVFEDGKLVREQEIEDLPYNEYFTTALDEPLLIDGNKEIKIGIKIHDYDAGQIPLLYASSDKFIAGKSDLYSEDNGATWQKVSDLYEEDNPYGMCCWNITGCVTDEPELNPEAIENLYYNIYRNGEVLSTDMLDKLQSHYFDKDAKDGDSYYVIAYYADGSVSDASEAFIFDSSTDISQYTIDDLSISFNSETKDININGEFDKAEIFNTNGICVSQSAANSISLNGVTPGIYVLKISKGGKAVVKKIIIK